MFKLIQLICGLSLVLAKRQIPIGNNCNDINLEHRKIMKILHKIANVTKIISKSEMRNDFRAIALFLWSRTGWSRRKREQTLRVDVFTFRSLYVVTETPRRWYVNENFSQKTCFLFVTWTFRKRIFKRNCEKLNCRERFLTIAAFPCHCFTRVTKQFNVLLNNLVLPKMTSSPAEREAQNLQLEGWTSVTFFALFAFCSHPAIKWIAW